MRMRFSTRLILSVVLIEAVMLSVLVWNSVRLISTSHAELLENSTRDEILLLANNLAPGLIASDVALLRDSLALLKNDRLVYITVFDRSGHVMASRGSHPSTDNHDESYEDALVDGVFDVSQEIVVYGQRLGALHAGYSIDSVRQLTATTRRQNTTIAAVELILSILATIFLGLILTRGLRKLEEGARIFGGGNLDYKIETNSNDEIADVARSFNDMASSVAENQRYVRESDQYNRMLFEQSSIGLALCRLNGDLVDVNPAFARIIGRSIEETLTLSYWDITPDSYTADEQVQLETLHETGRFGPYEKEYIHKDGHRVPVRLSGSFTEKDGETFILSSVEDVTGRKRTEEALRESQQMLQLVLDSIPVRVFWKDRDSVFLGCNLLFARDAGLESAEQIIGKTDFDLGWRSQAELYQSDDQRVIRSGVPKLNYEETQTRPDGRHLWLNTSKVPLNNLDGNVCGVIGIYEDITARRWAETELAKYREDLEELVAERTRMLRNAQDELVKKERLAVLGQLTATVSHELRNPLGAMRLSLYVIEKKSDKSDERIQKALERVDRNIDRCDRIVDELLDFTRTTELNRQSVRIDEWLESVIDEMDIPGDIRLEKDLSLMDVELAIDTSRLRRAVINVVENACHAMQEDGHPVNARNGSRLHVGTSGSDERIEIVITDNGSGIAKDVLEKIFEPLFSTRTFGVGLGMPAVKQVMEQHSGGIEIETEAGHGTKVTLWLPRSIAA